MPLISAWTAYGLTRTKMPAKPLVVGSVLGKLKSVVHGRKTAYTPRASACQACGLCVVSCPEKAIQLVASQP